MKKEIQAKIDDGYVYFTTIIEMVGKPQKHLDKTMVDYIKNIKANKKFEIVDTVTHEAIEVEDSESLYSTFSELTVLVKNMSVVYDFVFEYMPASIEIVEPENLEMKAADATGLVNDFIAKYHQVDMTAKQLQQKYVQVVNGLNKMAQNCVFLSIRNGAKNLDRIAKLTGIKAEHLEPLLSQLVKEEKIEKVGEDYQIKK